MRVLLLLSGGHDSRNALRTLLRDGHEVTAITFNGPQRSEIDSARQSAAMHGVRQIVYNAAWFDEITWNQWRLFRRFMRAFPIVVRHARAFRCNAIATGVKRSDIQVLPFLWPILPVVYVALRLIGLKIRFSVFELRV